MRQEKNEEEERERGGGKNQARGAVRGTGAEVLRVGVAAVGGGLTIGANGVVGSNGGQQEDTQQYRCETSHSIQSWITSKDAKAACLRLRPKLHWEKRSTFPPIRKLNGNARSFQGEQHCVTKWQTKGSSIHSSPHSSILSLAGAPGSLRLLRMNSSICRFSSTSAPPRTKETQINK